MGQGSAEGGNFPAAPATFEVFVGKQRSILVKYLRGRVSREDDVQDIVQESFIRLMRYREGDPGSWGVLLYKIARNVLNDRLRQAHVRRDIHYVRLDDGDDVISPEPGHEQRIASQQDLARLQRALLRLPKRCRQMYLLNRIEGMSYPEIADHCGIGVKAVEKHISKALMLLRQNLGNADQGVPS